ncbi:deoxyribonuclease-4 [Desulfotomaculum arcticum]|uniref:Deoxyribonuclease-4 n=1 Tax=Desulfotruncus arcticus DSM 17038 TaxID=1121424 RepID=A0A1I2ZNU1_9FIRM|nr:TIM barrel protein [Desulfotruncus arcticus]SFH39414.1 deoxyribonuclease-4 [Desulfotomaculum arcticum] [Desulfotruncus arcticus DSM 17038]
MQIRFGPAGNSDSFYAAGFKSSLDMPGWLAQLGLNAYEYQCVRGVHIKEETARKLGEAAARHGIALSIHGPYYISLATTDEAIKVKTKKHFLDSLRAARWMDAGVVVFHPTGGSGKDRAATLKRAGDYLVELLKIAEAEGYGDVKVAPETMGKPAQLGNLEEVLELCTLDHKIVPAIDFGHLHAAGAGALVTEEKFAEVLDRIEQVLGKESVKNLHIHFSPIEYTKAGERRHLTTLDEGYGPDFTFLARQIKQRGMSPTVICESAGRQAEDALVFRQIYENVAG